MANFVQDTIDKAVQTTTPIGVQDMFNAKGTRAEPGVISSQQGKDIVRKKDEALARIEEDRADITDEDARTQLADIQKKAQEAQTKLDTFKKTEKSGDKVTFVNPETGAEQTLRGDALTPKARRALENQGFVVAESDVAIGDKDPEIAVLEQEAEAARGELTRFSEALEDQAISSKELRSTIRSIQKVYSGRIAAMEEINRRRQDAIRTLGVRLGSRYTGGTKGVFGGVIAEEERQGLSRIQAIEAEMQGEIENAKNAAREFNFTLYSEATDRAEKLFKEKAEAVEALKKAQAEEQEKIEEEEARVSQQSEVISQISLGLTDPTEIFTALGGAVPYDVVKEITDGLPEPESVQEPIKLGSGDMLVDPVTGAVIARGSKVGGGGGGSYVGNAVGYGTSPVTVGTPTVEGLGTTYENSSTDAQLLIDDIVNGLPTQLINNVAEIPRWRETVRKQMQAGYKPQEIIDKLTGFRLFEGANKELGTTFYNMFTGTDVKPQNISDLINRGAIEQAMTTVENAQLDNVRAFFAETDKARGTVAQANNVLRILNDPNFPKDELGAFDGRKFKVARFFGMSEQDADESDKFSKTDVVKIQQLESALQLLNAPIRVDIVGTAATEAEMSKITGFQADILDQPNIVESMVTDLRDSVLRFHNEARAQRGLPQVGQEELTDNKKRLELYKSISGTEQQAIVSQMSNEELEKTIDQKAGFSTANSTKSKDPNGYTF